MKHQFANVESIFAHNEASMLNTQELGNCFHAFYSGDGNEMTSYYEKIQSDMSANQKIIEKNRKILQNLRTQMEDINMDNSMFMDLSKKREVDRKKYDHYRGKLNKLKEKAAKSAN